MSDVVKKIMIRVIKERMSKGESLEEIFARYPKLTKKEKEELRKAVS